MRSGSSIPRAAVYAAIILAVVAGASYLINSRIGGIQVYDVYPTPSMVPTLEVGDLVVVQSVPFSSLHPGDVVVFAEPSQTGACTNVDIVHRIIDITAEGTLITQGDNRLTNPVPDEPPLGGSWPQVPAGCVKGEVVLSLPYLGRISEAFPPPLNYILVVIIIVTVFLMELVSGGKGKKAEEEPTAVPKQARAESLGRSTCPALSSYSS